MGIKEAKAKLNLLGIQIEKENNFALIYTKSGNEVEKCLILVDDNNNIAYIKDKFTEYEVGDHFVAIGDQYGCITCLYVKNQLENILSPNIIYRAFTDDNIMTYKAKLNKSKVIVVKSNTDLGTENILVNYQGKILKFRIKTDKYWNPDILVKNDNHNGGVVVYYTYNFRFEHINLFRIDDDFEDIEILNKKQLLSIIVERPETKVIYIKESKF